MDMLSLHGKVQYIFVFHKLCDIMTSRSFLGVYAFKNNRSQWEVSV